MELFRCATCGNALSVPVELVALPAGPRSSLLGYRKVNPPLLDPRTYAIDEVAYGRDRVVGTFVLSPGDVRGTRFVHDRVEVGCLSLVGWEPCMACDGCGVLVASRTDDCYVAQETRLHPGLVVRETCDDGADRRTDPFALIADWDTAAPDTKRHFWCPDPIRPRPELTATRWRGRDVAEHLYRDDPPA